MVTLNAKLSLWPLCVLNYLYGHYVFQVIFMVILRTKISFSPLRGLSSRANYTDRAAAAGRRSYCQLLRIEGYHVVSATDPHGR